MYTFLHQQFKAILDQYINKHKCILVALSGGQDSLCLLKLLTDLLNQEKCKIKAIYLDHQWKNNSKKHAQHMANIAKFTSLSVAIYQIKELTLSENEARKIRYEVLIQHALKENCGIIVTGHNRDDRVETLISNLLRGTSTNGVTNFTICKKLKSKLSILRPLIHFSKAEIAWLCRLFYLPTWSDETNNNFNLKRNRIRYELVPYMRNFFNPKIQVSLAHFSQLGQEDNEYIKENTLKLYIKSRHYQFLCINLGSVKKQHLVLQKRVVRLYFYYHFNKTISEEAVKRILANKKNSSQSLSYCDMLNIQVFNDWLCTWIE